MQRININLTPFEKESAIIEKCAAILICSVEDITGYRIIKKSIDARRKDNITILYTVDVQLKNGLNINISPHKDYLLKIPQVSQKIRPIIVGFGPSGMFAALTFIKAGIMPVIFERGSTVEERIKKVNYFWEKGVLDSNTNVQFGEGGAGTFSDGKLTTNKNSAYNEYVLSEFIKHGAPHEIEYSAKPHIGTDNLIETVKNIRKTIISAGAEIHFNCRVDDIIIKNNSVAGVVAGGREYLSNYVLCCIGHSADNIYRVLYSKNVAMRSKPFSVGVRIEHLQEEINKSQYGKFFKCASLGAADYKLVYHNRISDRSAYTFCMCPGGRVVASSAGNESIVTNGMSNFARDGLNANSAILVGVNAGDFHEGVLGGLDFRAGIEKKAYLAGGGNFTAPVQTVGDFLTGRTGGRGITPTYKPEVSYTDINAVLPPFVSETLKEGIKDMGKKLKGFDNPYAVLTGVETRSSSPLTVLRNENFESINTKGLYPCGEGCGYAGGIMSAAFDGISAAMKIITNLAD